jgi:hypothetical protein
VKRNLRPLKYFFGAFLWPKQLWAKHGRIPFLRASVMAQTKI